MDRNQKKQKSFIYDFTWVSIMLIGMGILFLLVPTILQIVDISPESVNYYHNGVKQPSTQETLNSFRMMFWLIFGSFALVMLIIGTIFAIRRKTRNNKNETLKREGTRLYAEFSGFAGSNVEVNNRNVSRLLCKYTDNQGRTYVFKSGLLRIDPSHYLRDGRVIVYHERGNLKKYFVDIDASAGLGTTLFEL